MKRLHTNVPIFFSDPIIIAVTYPETSRIDGKSRWTDMKIYCRNEIKGTWGNSNISYEYISGKPDSDLFVERSFWCFSDELDVLQFMIKFGEFSERWHVWPRGTKFNITEYTKD